MKKIILILVIVWLVIFLVANKTSSPKLHNSQLVGEQGDSDITAEVAVEVVEEDVEVIKEQTQETQEVQDEQVDLDCEIVEDNTKIKNNKHIIMEATAYTKSVEEGTQRGITRSGTEVSRGTVAVDPRAIPLGTRLYVDGYGDAIALDTGGAIKGNRIDLYMETKKEAFEWGRRQVKVWILK